MRFRTIVFDFDGTLVDSNALKHEGFVHVFDDHPDCIRALPEALGIFKSASRYEIIKSLVKGIRGLTPHQRLAEAERRTEAYSKWVEEQILERARRSPAGVLLPRWQCHAALYICSLTPTEALKRILQKAEWLRYFEGVEGHPVNKADMLRRTVLRHGLRADEALMVGDGDSDEMAATETGTAFFRIREIRDLNQLEQYLFT